MQNEQRQPQALDLVVQMGSAHILHKSALQRERAPANHPLRRAIRYRAVDHRVVMGLDVTGLHRRCDRDNRPHPR